MSLVVYNTISRKKEEFIPINEGRVGMYVCGPTVYGLPHLGHAKSYISFDVVYRYLMYLGYKVKYVQNITDVGHLTGDGDEGEDKITKQALKESIDPYAIAYKYENAYFDAMEKLNILKPSISARATGHIIEIIDMIKTLIEKDYAYVTSEGNVYFRVSKFNDYGKLSNRNLEDIVSGERITTASDKENESDFALWKKAEDNHLMKWPSPWSIGYPGWHAECSVMSKKYLGDTFDIHGGGMDNMFPHHECEIAQSVCANEKPFVKYFMHNNLVTTNGQKMGKSLGNFKTLEDLFNEYDPMFIRYYILQTHYRRPTEFNIDLLNEEYKNFNKIKSVVNNLRKNLKETDKNLYTPEVYNIKEKFLEAMNDDFNTSLALSYLHEIIKLINVNINKNEEVLVSANNFISECIEGILGIKFEENQVDSKETELLELIASIRKSLRESKNFELADSIRDSLKSLGFEVNDR